MDPLRVKLPLITIIGWSCIAFFGFCTVASRAANFPGWPLFLCFAALGALCLLIDGPLEMNEQFVRHTSILFGRCQINWDEVEMVDMNPQSDGNDMVLHGQGKRLAVPGPNLWSGRDKAAMLTLFQKQLQERGIRIVRTYRSGTQFSKNVRMSRRS